MKSKKSWVLLISGIVMIAVLAVIIISVTNWYLERHVTALLDEQIVENNLKNVVSYGDVQVQAHRGSLQINSIEFLDEDITLSIGSTALHLPLGQLFALAMRPQNTTLTDISIHLSSIKGIDEYTSLTIEQERADLTFKGSLNTKVFFEDSSSEPIEDDTRLQELSMDLVGLRLITPIGVMALQSYSLDIEGDFLPSAFIKDLQTNPSAYLVQALDKASFRLEQFTVELDEDIREMAEFLASLYLGRSSYLGDAGNWRIEKLSFDADSSDTTVSLSNVECIAAWIHMGAEASFSLEEPFDTITPLEITVTMYEYIDELRPLFELFVKEMSQSNLPTGTFSVTFYLRDSDSLPEITIGKPGHKST